MEKNLYKQIIGYLIMDNYKIIKMIVKHHFLKKSIKYFIYLSGLYLLRNFYNNYIDTITYNNISFTN